MSITAESLLNYYSNNPYYQKRNVTNNLIHEIVIINGKLFLKEIKKILF